MQSVSHFSCFFESRITTNSNNSILMGLRKLKNLRKLHLEESFLWHTWRSAFDDQALFSIMNGAGGCLQKLTLITGKNFEDQDKCVTNNSLAIINEICPNLTFLSLKCVDISDLTLASIGKLLDLQKLRLHSLPYVTNDGITKFIFNCSHIKNMNIMKCPRKLINFKEKPHFYLH